MSKQKPHLDQLSKRYPAKRVFITGAGSGLGLAFAMELAESGWKVAITDIDQKRLEAAAQKIDRAGGMAIPYEFDVSSYEKFSEAVSDFELQHGGIDIGINNAGIACGGYLHDVPIETFRKVIEVNVMGVAHGCHLFVPIMRRQRFGHILNVASAAAFGAPPRMSAYNTSKAAVLALSETLRSELFEDGVFVSVLMPTYVRTNIGKDALGSIDDKHIAEMLVEESELTTENVALETLQKMASNAFYVVLPNEARFLWRFKRFMPDRFRRYIAKEAKRRRAQLASTRDNPDDPS